MIRVFGLKRDSLISPNLVRRIKCDAAKPFCLRCTSTGRNCDGYQPTEAGTFKFEFATETPLPPLRCSAPSSSIALGNEQERRSFFFFCNRSRVQLSGLYGSDFWTSLIPQAAHSDSGIRHAIIALGSIHERFEQHNITNFYIGPGDILLNFSLQQYNLAIKKLVEPHLKQQSSAVDVYLASCIIFICIEVRHALQLVQKSFWLISNPSQTLCGHLTSAIALVRNGISILRQNLSDEGNLHPFSSHHTFSTTPFVPLATLKTLFDRLETQVIAVR